MNQPGNGEFAPPAIAAKLRGGELPARLPIEGGQTLTLHGQLDAIGPSDRHPDLVKLEVSFPPAQAPGKSALGQNPSGQ